jgi:environmental stress-induced protein Ves
LFAPYRFAGELSTHGALDAPPARDFNVMVRRDQASAEVSVHALALGAWAQIEGVETQVVHVLRGAVAVQAGGEHQAVAAGETLVASEGTPLGVTATLAGTVAIFVTIGPPRR